MGDFEIMGDFEVMCMFESWVTLTSPPKPPVALVAFSLPRALVASPTPTHSCLLPAAWRGLAAAPRTEEQDHPIGRLYVLLDT